MTDRIRRCVCVLAALLVGALACSSPKAPLASELPVGGRGDVFVSARQMIDKPGEATVLDARSRTSYMVGHIPGASSSPWTSFTTGSTSGHLLPTADLQALLRERGVSGDHRVVVVADWQQGWGEEGHLFWLLRYLGHSDVRVLYGGMAAWTHAGGSIERLGGRVKAGDFTATPRVAARASSETLRSAPSTVVLDARKQAEFDGATPYGSKRGGHIPGAHPFYWRDALDARGDLRDVKSLRAALRTAGLSDPQTPVTTYCTGGVRSGFLYMVLVWLDFANVSNYDGSWWEWSANADLPVEGPPQ